MAEGEEGRQAKGEFQSIHQRFISASCSKGNIYINLAAGRTRNSVKRLPTLHCTGSVHSSDAYILAVYVAQSLTVQMQ